MTNEPTTPRDQMRYRTLGLRDPHAPHAGLLAVHASAFPLGHSATPSVLLGMTSGPATLQVHLTPAGARELGALLIEQADHADPAGAEAPEMVEVLRGVLAKCVDHHSACLYFRNVSHCSCGGGTP